MPDILYIFDYLSVAALIFMSYGVLSQIQHIYKTKSVRDISFKEVFIRTLITWILLVKIILIGDKYLIVGQIIFGFTILLYFFVLLYFKKKGR